jgi:VWFA-related protein
VRTLTERLTPFPGRLTLAVLLTALCLVAPPAPAQETRRAVSDRISVTVVEVPVQVLHKGKPVAGLTAEDFEVFDRGNPKTIVDFDVLDLSMPEATATDATLGSPLARERNRHLLILIDLDFTEWEILPRAILGARELLADQLHSTDQVAVGFLSPTVGAQLLHNFTVDREPPRAALDVLAALVDRDVETAAIAMEELAVIAGLNIQGMEESPDSWRELARRWLRGSSLAVGASPLMADQPINDPGALGSAPARDEVALDPVRVQAYEAPSLFDEQVLRRLMYLSKTLGSLTRSLDTIPEPKQILLFSAGVPTRFLDSQDHTVRTLARLDRVVKACLEAGWVLNAIDVRGIPGIEESVFDGNALFHLASQTGGALYENFNEVGAATRRIVDRSEITYILVIQPDVEVDGSFHELEVRLKNAPRGHKLQYRPGYRAPTPVGRRMDLDNRRDIAELILGKGELEDFEFDLMTLPVPVVAGRGAVPVVVEIPGEVLLENPFGDIASVEVHAYGLDSQGGIQDLFVKRLDVDLKRSGKKLARGGLRVVGELDLGAGRNEVRVLVRNLSNDGLSLESSQVDLPSLARTGVAVMPPMFVDQTRDWVSLSVKDVPEGEQRAYVALGETYFPNLSPLLKRKGMQPLVLNVFIATEEMPRLQMRVLSARGEEVEGPRIFLGQRFARLDGGLGLTATLEPRGLAPGGYSLEIALVDPSSGARVTSSQRFVIEEPSKG